MYVKIRKSYDNILDCGAVKDETLKYFPNVHNYALHVDHPHFVAAFKTFVLPKINELERTPALKKYIAKHNQQ